MATSKQNATRLQGSTRDARVDPPGTAGLDELLRSLPGMQVVMDRIRDLARIDVPMLIEGEPGTGVDFAAQEIHALSQRRLQPFVSVPCAAMPEATLADHLCGFERRSFTGATEEQPGVFELAHGGTVFFDEICSVPQALQIQLARLLKNREITRIGQSRSRKVDVRLICGTRFNLSQEAAEGRFHPDLLYRIRVAQVRLPPLRERLVDLPPLITFYLLESRLTPDRPAPSLNDEATRLLLAYPWPGNMTELQSAIQFAALGCPEPPITAMDLPQEIRTAGTAGALQASPGQTEKDRFLAAVGAAKGNRTLAARLLGISRATLYRRLKDLGIESRT